MTTFLLLLLSCFKPKIVDHATARDVFLGEDCIEELKTNILQTDCSELEYFWQADFDIVFRCHKPAEERSNFWDTHIFRISPAALENYQDDKLYLEQHTICVDSVARVSAYHPDTWSK